MEKIELNLEMLKELIEEYVILEESFCTEKDRQIFAMGTSVDYFKGNKPDEYRTELSANYEDGNGYKFAEHLLGMITTLNYAEESLTELRQECEKVGNTVGALGRVAFSNRKFMYNESVKKDIVDTSLDLYNESMRLYKTLMDINIEISPIVEVDFSSQIQSGRRQMDQIRDFKQALIKLGEMVLEEIEEIISQLCGCIEIETLETNGMSEMAEDVENRRKKTDVQQKILDMIKIAEGERGTKEEGNNHVKYNEWFWEEDLSAAWCAAYVLWCGNQAGLMDGNTMPKFEDREGMALVTNLRGWYSEKGRYYSNDDEDYIPCQGDFFISRTWSSKNNKWQYHTGIVVGYDKETKKIYTIEGNAGDAVQHGIREVKVGSDSGVQGFCSNGGMEAELPSDWETWNDVDNIENVGTR